MYSIHLRLIEQEILKAELVTVFETDLRLAFNEKNVECFAQEINKVECPIMRTAYQKRYSGKLDDLAFMSTPDLVRILTKWYMDASITRAEGLAREEEIHNILANQMIILSASRNAARKASSAS